MFKKVVSLILLLSLLLLNALPTQASTAVWERLTDAPVPLAGAGVVEASGKVYVIGGADQSVQRNNVWEVNPATGAWTEKAPMPTARSRAGVAVANNKIYVVGGEGAGGTYLAVTEVYDPALDQWTTLKPMNVARAWVTATSIGALIYSFGGNNNPAGFTETTYVEAYDPSTNTWTAKAIMPTALRGAAAATINGKAYVLGGSKGSTSTVFLNTLHVYDPTTNSWTTAAPMSVSRQGAGAAVYNGKLYAAGGISAASSTSTTATDTVEIYDPVANAWSQGPRMSVARYSLGTTVANGRLFAIGGSANAGVTNFQSVKTVEVLSVAHLLTLTAAGGNASVTLNWNAEATATGYKIERSTTPGGPYATIAASVTGTTYTDTNVTNGTAYYYVVTAFNGTAPIVSSNEASATPQGAVPETDGHRAILVITLNTGLEKEYDLSMKEVVEFINWYEGRAEGMGSVVFAIDKHGNNKGPFLSRKDYIVFDKVLTFEVNEY